MPLTTRSWPPGFPSRYMNGGYVLPDVADWDRVLIWLVQQALP